MALTVLLLHACSGAAHRGDVRPATRVLAPAQKPFGLLADDMSYDCIRSATDPHVPLSAVYRRCLAAHDALLNAKTRQPYRAVAARSCLIERDAACLEQWARYQ
jgi:hypothetical protein